MRRGKKMWGGRFHQPTDPLVEKFTTSIQVDYRLAWYDVHGSIAHAKMLGKTRIIPPADAGRLVRGLARIQHRIERGEWTPDPKVEDIHTQIQQMLQAEVGPVAGKLHTARSRNDQVVLDLRLYCRDAVTATLRGVRALQRSLVETAESNKDVVIPGYTHLQRAQPVLFAHHLLAYVEMLERDAERLTDSRKRIDVLPLGAAALAGTSLPIDRRYVAKLLGFPRVAQNSMDAVSDRDFAMELLSVLASISVHLSRLAEDVVLWTSQEFGILSLDDAFATGSSIMPQKKNPDVLELIRGQAGVLIGELAGFLTVMKGLPLSYNRDLQWDKRFVFEAVEAVQSSLGVLAPLMAHVQIRPATAAALLQSDTMCATDLAEFLVERGIAFREAHEIVGHVVAAAEHRGLRLCELPLKEFQHFSPKFSREALALLDPKRSVEHKRSEGSTNPALVAKALAQWRRRLKAA